MARGAPRCRVGVGTLAGACSPTSLTSSQQAAQGECPKTLIPLNPNPEVAPAPPRLPSVLLPESSLASNSHAVHTHTQDPTLPDMPPPPPDPALGGVVLTGGGVSAVGIGKGFHAHVSSKPDPVSATLSLAPLGTGAEQQPNTHAAESAHLLLPAGCPGPAAGAQGAPMPQTLEQGPLLLRCAWRQRLRECVDAAPVVVAQPCAAQGVVGKPLTQNPSMSAGLPGWRWYALACSHGGDVVCIEGRTGARVWGARLPGRADIGLAVLADLQALLSKVKRLVV